jgi:hypothetical protein
MKTTLLFSGIALVSFCLCLAALPHAVVSASSQEAQKPATPPPPPDFASQVPAAKPEDVSSSDAILHAIYDVISGPAGDRDWNRFRSLFIPQARLTYSGKRPDGSVVSNAASVDDYIKRAGTAFAKQAFYENSIVNQVQRYGNVAQVFSSYESRRAPSEKPFQRGINCIQLLYDGKRWWVVSILWDWERPDNPLPGELASAPPKQ